MRRPLRDLPMNGTSLDILVASLTDIVRRSALAALDLAMRLVLSRASSLLGSDRLLGHRTARALADLLDRST
jgi:hypothetical protein